MGNVLVTLKEWAKLHKISRRKAEYLAKARPDLVVMMPKVMAHTIHVKCVESQLKPTDF